MMESSLDLVLGGLILTKVLLSVNNSGDTDITITGLTEFRFNIIIITLV